MISPFTQKKLLQIVVAIACVVPISAGISGAVSGAPGSTLDLDSHFRYLSGLLLGIGFGFVTAIPTIERQSARFRLLTLIVVTGGLCRLLGYILVGLPDAPMIAAIMMELVVTPLLCLWQHRVARRLTDRI